jgi:leucyl aminopeptidase
VPSTRAPRLIDMNWGNPKHPKADAGRQGRLLRHRRPRHEAVERHAAIMKKDMGGAANVLALAALVMAFEAQGPPAAC